MDYCKDHRSFFCPCAAERLYRTPFVTKKDEWSLQDHRDEWDTTEKREREKNVERWKILQKGDSNGT